MILVKVDLVLMSTVGQVISLGFLSAFRSRIKGQDGKIKDPDPGAKLNYVY